ncbi:SpoIIE family protein phosphatase [Streptacidiphilus melanogenes]|uniref:SpoIIE family protein phosphatase n=1 Tax=Streptacidiphilus melanogenes TaxID=411235 RepID=UPI001EED61CF|nr:SpoIIE family protein phosphatase [Streptacidiphilus melanogenes]
MREGTSREGASWGDRGSAQARERFLGGDEVRGVVRAGVLASWERCRATGLSAERTQLRYDPDPDGEERLLLASLPVLERLHEQLLGTRVSVLLADAHARVMDRRAGEPALDRHLDAVQLAPGFSWAEHDAGTNGIGTALVEGRPGVVLGSEHFSEAHRAFACTGAPIRDPLTGAIRGVVDLTTWRRDAHPLMAALAREAATAVEHRLLEQYTLRERAHHDRALRTAARRGAVQHRPTRGRRTSWEAALPLRALTARHPAHPALAVVPPRGQGSELPSPGAQRPGAPCTGTRCGGEPSHGGTELGTPTREAVSREPLSREAPPLRGPHLWVPSPVVPSGRGTCPERPRPGRPPLGGAADEVTARAVVSVRGGDSGREGSVSRRTVDREPEDHTPAHGGSRPWAPVHSGSPSAAPSAGGSAVTSGAPGSLSAGVGVGVGRIAVAARHRLTLLWEAGVRIGTTLDVGQTAHELAEVALPEFAQYAAVDLADWVPEGAEAPAGADVGPLRRAATRTIRARGALLPVGAPVGYPVGSAQARALTSGRAVLDEESTSVVRTESGLEDYRVGAVIAVPLSARGTVLGVASFYRSVDAGPFHGDDLTLAEELAHRAAVCLDNARRYTREHALALTLQRSLLPRALPELPAIEVAHRYLPAQEGVGGDWFDVIPLSGARVALVVGDVVGHGIHAAATMGRLRTAVRNFSALDLPPEELLGHLDALVDAMDQEEGELGGIGIIGATCLYVIYDPVSHSCTLASAGHPSPALLLPDGSVGFPEVPSGPPLGLGSTPFEAVEFALPEDSEIVLYTDGLIEDRDRDIDVGLARLADVLATARAGRDRTPEALCTAVVSALLPERPRDDVALLIARTRGVSGALVARWPVPLEPAAVAGLRAQVRARLRAWGLAEVAGTVELMVSELVTNAIRHATGPVELRLLRDRGLICEVADGSSVSPRMRRARSEDEGGRGLFLVAQLAERWGTRFTSGGGKVIWAELKTRAGLAKRAEPRPQAAGVPLGVTLGEQGV